MNADDDCSKGGIDSWSHPGNKLSEKRNMLSLFKAALAGVALLDAHLGMHISLSFSL